MDTFELICIAFLTFVVLRHQSRLSEVETRARNTEDTARHIWHSVNGPSPPNV